MLDSGRKEAEGAVDEIGELPHTFILNLADESNIIEAICVCVVLTFLRKYLPSCVLRISITKNAINMFASFAAACVI